MSAVLASTRATRPAWLDAACRALAQVVEPMLEAQVTSIEPAGDQHVAGVAAYVPVMAPGDPVQVGVVASADDAAAIARRMLQLPDDEPIGEGDIGDAIGELANMIAGATKASLASEIGVVALGLPVVVNGRVAESAHHSVREQIATVGPWRVGVVVVAAM